MSLETSRRRTAEWWGSAANLPKCHQGGDDAEKQSKGLRAGRQASAAAGLELQNNPLPCLLHAVNYKGIASFPPGLGSQGG